MEEDNFVRHFHGNAEELIKKFFPKMTELDIFFEKSNLKDIKYGKELFYLEVSQTLNSLGYKSDTNLGKNEQQLNDEIDTIRNSTSETKKLLEKFSQKKLSSKHHSAQYEIIRVLRKNEGFQNGEGYLDAQYKEGKYMTEIDRAIDSAILHLCFIKNSLAKLSIEQFDIQDSGERHSALLVRLYEIYRNHIGEVKISEYSDAVFFLVACLEKHAEYSFSKTNRAIVQKLKRFLEKDSNIKTADSTQ